MSAVIYLPQYIRHIDWVSFVVPRRPSGSSPTALSCIPREIIIFLRGAWGSADLPKVGGRSAGGLSYGFRAPPKLLAEAKSDDNERKLRARDLTRSGPWASEFSDLFRCNGNQRLAAQEFKESVTFQQPSNRKS